MPPKGDRRHPVSQDEALTYKISTEELRNNIFIGKKLFTDKEKKYAFIYELDTGLR